MKGIRESLQLYAVTGRSGLSGLTLEAQVEAALLGGVTLIQLREKTFNRQALLEQAIRIKKLTERFDVPLIINDDVEVALLSGAEGVHLGPGDTCVKEARARLGGGAIIGASARTVDQAVQAQRDGADYLGCGAVFGTSTKPDATAMSRETLTAICDSVSIPVVAIGGICRENIPGLSGTGVSGVAVVSAIFAQPDIEAAAKELLILAKEIVTLR